MKTKYLIVAVWKDGRREIVDETNSKKDAKYLVSEYSVAYGFCAKEVYYIEEN